MNTLIINSIGEIPSKSKQLSDILKTHYDEIEEISKKYSVLLVEEFIKFNKRLHKNSNMTLRRKLNKKHDYDFNSIILKMNDELKNIKIPSNFRVKIIKFIIKRTIDTIYSGNSSVYLKIINKTNEIDASFKIWGRTKLI